MTSSPSPIPQTRKFNSSAAVAEFRHTTLLVWQYSASLFSSSFVLGPVVIQPLLIASATSFISSSEMSGGLNGITLFSIIVLPLPFLLFFIHTRCGHIPFQPANPLNHAISTLLPFILTISGVASAPLFFSLPSSHLNPHHADVVKKREMGR